MVLPLCEIWAFDSDKYILDNKMSGIIYLTLQDILDVNKFFYMKSLENPKIIYGANSDDEMDKIEKMIKCTPKNKSIIEVAAYYLKNITILQAFSDGNHRTAIYSILLFFKKNEYTIKKITLEDSLQLQNDIDNACFKVYKFSYHAMNTDVLNDNNSKVYLVCLDFIKKRLL